MAITRSMTRGNDPPASDESKPPDKTVARKRPAKSKAPSRRRIAQDQKVDRLTALPLELFRMILEELVLDLVTTPSGSWKAYEAYHRNLELMIKLSLVSKLFLTEITDAIFRLVRPVTTSNSNVWRRLAVNRPLMISRLLHEEVRARPISNIGILALINQVVDKILLLKNENSRTYREIYLKAACCFAFHASSPMTIIARLTLKTGEAYNPRGKILFKQDVINNCWAVAAWMGDCSLLDILESKYGPIARKLEKKDHPLYFGSALWAAARNGQMEAIKYLQRKQCDFGGLEEQVHSILSPLCGAIRGNHVQAFEEILPAYDRHRNTDAEPGRSIMSNVCYKVAANGSEEIARIFWTRMPHVHLDILGQALNIACGSSTGERIKVAKVLIEAGAPINRNILRKAILSGGPQILQLLIQNGGNLEANGGSAIESALEFNNTEAMKILLQHCKWEEATTKNVLQEAVEKNRLEMVKILVSPENFDPTASERAAEIGRHAAKTARNSLKIKIYQELAASGCE